MKPENMEKITFNKPVVTGKEISYLKSLFNNSHFAGDGEYTKKCENWLSSQTNSISAHLTTSCTDALELSGLLLDLKAGDEVIVPSYTFVSTASAFALRGARIKFVDIEKKTMNIDVKAIEQAINPKTKAIVVVHYAGVGCEMDAIVKLASKHNLLVIEDAAQAIHSTYKGKSLGAIGDLGTFSFHQTKNIQCGEGGALLVNRESFSENAEILREKGTNRQQFIRGQVDKYSWRKLGSSFLPSELNSAFLYAQLLESEQITHKRIKLWNKYNERLDELKGYIELPFIPNECEHNAHMFYIKTKDIDERTKLTQFLNNNNIQSVFHYIPLHSSIAGLKYGDFVGNDINTTRESERLLRLPLYFDLSEDQVHLVCDKVKKFYKGK